MVPSGWKSGRQPGRDLEAGAPLRDANADTLAGPGNRVDRFILDLTFEATPETAAAVIADLESAEEVAAVGRVQMRRVEAGRGERSSGRIRVTLSPEAWILVPAGGRS